LEFLIMSKRSSAKYKLDRRMGENVFGRPKSPVNRREYGPGQHGQRRKGKISDFGIQLRAKQKLKGYYGDVTEKQFKRTFQQASSMKGDTSQNLIGLLERRLDMVVYRAKFAPTIWAARQLVNHGHIRVNGRKLNIASARVNVGDVVELGAKAQEMALVIEAQGLAERDIPDYVVPDGTTKITFNRVPTLDEVPYPGTRCPIRSAWSRTWSSSSTRADPIHMDEHQGPATQAAGLFVSAAGICSQEGADALEHLPACLAVGKVVLEPWKEHQLALALGVAQCLVHPPRVGDQHIEITLAVEQQHRRANPRRIGQRRALADMRPGADIFGGVARTGKHARIVLDLLQVGHRGDRHDGSEQVRLGDAGL
jgi:small subunit ribosomal protein S4